MTLVEFLTARLDEDAREHGNPWGMNSWHSNVCDVVQDPGRTGGCDCGVAARVLRDVESKRALLALAGEGYLDRGVAWLAGEVRRHLAAAYADHPDYDERWRP